MKEVLLSDNTFLLIVWVISLVLTGLAAFALGYFLGKANEREDNAFYHRPDSYANSPRFRGIPR